MIIVIATTHALHPSTLVVVAIRGWNMSQALQSLQSSLAQLASAPTLRKIVVGVMQALLFFGCTHCTHLSSVIIDVPSETETGRRTRRVVAFPSVHLHAIKPPEFLVQYSAIGAFLKECFHKVTGIVSRLAAVKNVVLCFFQ